MSTFLDLVRRIKAALLGAPAHRPASEKVKLATRNGYGGTEAGPPVS
jgi:hypothetical protein